ncbi:MAG TPA: hypothetical protein VFU76_01050 [Terriglobales bacterium]|nr:hypothetical protein [Terriglobales bacterium]
MKPNWLLGLVLALLLCGVGLAQSPPNVDTGGVGGIPGMGSSTWTGTLKSFDQATRSITLQREHKGKEEDFTAVVGSGVKFLDAKGRPEEGRNLKVGEKLRVYYSEMRPKNGGDKENVISRIDLLERGKGKGK